MFLKSVLCTRKLNYCLRDFFILFIVNEYSVKLEKFNEVFIYTYIPIVACAIFKSFNELTKKNLENAF